MVDDNGLFSKKTVYFERYYDGRLVNVIWP